MTGERGKEGAGRIGSRKAENRRGPTPGVAAPAEIGHPARGDNARPRKEGDAQAPGMRVTFQPHAGGGAADTANGPGVGGSGQGALQFLNDFRLILVPLLGTDGVYGNAPHGLIPHAQDMGNADGPFKQHPLGRGIPLPAGIGQETAQCREIRLEHEPDFLLVVGKDHFRLIFRHGG